MQIGAIPARIAVYGGVDEDEEGYAKLCLGSVLILCDGVGGPYQCAGDIDACVAGGCAVQPFWPGELEAEEPVAGHSDYVGWRQLKVLLVLFALWSRWLKWLSRELGQLGEGTCFQERASDR